MIKPILFASIAWLWSEALYRLSRARLAILKNWKGASSSLPNAVFRVRAEEERIRSRKAGARDRLHAWESKLTRRFVERPFSVDPPVHAGGHTAKAAAGG